ncbi:MAG: 5-(carboxyamino)imidazole ribonucleotide mutase [Gammaproteobacteria bacterium]|nr:5-(carboxyamino)imidazole ribonucleotide mutase [Gammaproteobacteria bacterium]MDE0223827.1 5-(carboxyamino)imidazole ribonucleotide mutase [Gammaproteobacteria bacterium]MDE0451009.1 5-(carboxyamino)imidazole ribonucleotide mutase [Gammaproteobacteria bacterium]
MSWVAILMGSESDWPTMRGCADVLADLDVGFEVRVTSAHRTPAATAEYVADALSRDCGVFVCGAGMAAHLAGAVAAQTVRPVIGVPIASGPLSGFDALLSTVQMPSGIPVATVAVGGAKNAGYLAAQIIAAGDAALSGRLGDDREANRQGVARQNASVQEDLAGDSG